MPEAILGISAFYHDSAAAMLVDGEIIAAAQEERFTRKKHDDAFPVNAIKYVLAESGIKPDDLQAVVFYEKPLVKFERLLETYHALAPRGLNSFLTAIPVWIKGKLFMKKLISEEVRRICPGKYPILFTEHHLSHAASAFYPSPFQEAAVLTVDGVGEWATSTISHGKGNRIEIKKELHFPHSIGLLYSAFTYYCGFRVNSGEYKLMGLAPYGNPDSQQVSEFKDKIQQELVDIREDGSILLNLKYFNFASATRMTYDKCWEELFGIPPRLEEADLSQDYMNMAMAIQQVTEDIIFKLAVTARGLTRCKHLVMAGGVALNSVANGKLLASGLFEDIWVQPAAGDAGGALGAAYAGWYIWKGKEWLPDPNLDKMKGAFLGPEYFKDDIHRIIRKYDADFEYYNDFIGLTKKVAQLIDEGKVVGWFQGRMEYGPRALGNRSILGDARNPEMQKKMNLKIKYREGFRPFAPAVLAEDIDQYFDLDRPSPYMLLVVPVKAERCVSLPDDFHEKSLYDRLYFRRSDVPAITHVDYSARLQSVDKQTNPRFWTLIREFRQRTGCSLVINTSFNVRGEPIVCTPDDAYRCFMRTEMDFLVMGDFLFDKSLQPDYQNGQIWQEKFNPD
jgi:carbamoyltransferase